MRLRSLLFVPGDRPERFSKAAASGADAIILDLEDAVAAEAKGTARAAVAAYLAEPAAAGVLRFVRINPLDSGIVEADLAAIAGLAPDGVLLPKCEGAGDLADLDHRLERAGDALAKILPIATETPAAIFRLGDYGGVSARLIGLTWGAEDLPAAVGASSAREADGRYTPPYELARSLTLFGAHAAGVAAIETVYPAFRDHEGLAAYGARARRDGFSGMLAIHPDQVPVINAAFGYGAAELARARAILAAAEGEAGAFQFEGAMIDAPHLKQARDMLARAGEGISQTNPRSF